MKKIFLPIIVFMIICVVPICTYAQDYVYTSSVSGELSLRLAPNESSAEILKIPACCKLKLAETRDTWGKIIYRKKSGWINLSFTRESYDSAAEVTGYDYTETVKVSAKKGFCELFSLPSENIEIGSKKKYTVPNDTVLNVTRKTENGWGLVSMNGKYAWVKMENTVGYATEAEKESNDYGIYYVYSLSKDGSGLALAAEKNSDNIIATIPDCYKLTVRNTDGNFGYVSYNGMNGWIDLTVTTNSLANAQANAGTAVNDEYVILGTEDVNLYSIPSDSEADGSFVTNTVEGGETVFVLRRTASGWSYINSAGESGWLPPDTTELKPPTDDDSIELCKNPYEVFIKSISGKGQPLYVSPNDDSDVITTLPETYMTKVLSEKNGFAYVCDTYTAGWVDLSQTVKSFDEAIMPPDGYVIRRYMITDETTLRSLPIYSENHGSKALGIVSVGTEFEVTKIVVTGKRKWGYTKIGNKNGWVNLNCAEYKEKTLLEILADPALAVVIAAILIIIKKFIMRRKKNA